MGLIKIADREVWGSSRGLLHVVLEFVADHTDDASFAEHLRFLVTRNDSAFHFDELDHDRKKIFYDGVAMLIENWWSFRDEQDEYDKSAFEFLCDLRSRL